MSDPTAAPVVIEARGLHKSFRIPEHRIDSLRERATHPFSRVEYREHRALRDVSFDVRQGEFFGIVGRNGSGKSSLLKILASIYRADGGRARVAGRVAPFIELGVGFNHELTARENVVLNGVLMGLTLREARRSLDAVMAFAELEDFVDLQLKNYSSGMLVRLAFAVMVQADADIMLIDEVLAVGDAAFAQKCMDVFHEKRRDGKTIVLVTHDMTTVQTLCHRAMLLHDGELRLHRRARGRRARLLPEELRGRRGRPAGRGGRSASTSTRGSSAPRCAGDADDARGGRADRARLRAGGGAAADAPELHHPRAQRQGPDGLRARPGGSTPRSRPGRRVVLAGPVENRLLPGRYSLDVYIREDGEEGQHDRAGAAAAALRRRRHLRRRWASSRSPLTSSPCCRSRPSERRAGRAARRPGPVRAGRRMAARARRCCT